MTQTQTQGRAEAPREAEAGGVLGAAVGTWVLGLRPPPAAPCLGNPKTQHHRPGMMFSRKKTLTPGSRGFRNHPGGPGGVLWGGERRERGIGWLSCGTGCAPSLSLLAVGSAKTNPTCPKSPFLFSSAFGELKPRSTPVSKPPHGHPQPRGGVRSRPAGAAGCRSDAAGPGRSRLGGADTKQELGPSFLARLLL